MALTYVGRKKDNLHGTQGGFRVWMGTITFDSSYPTGGEAVTAADFGMSAIHTMIISSTDEAGISARWDHANLKIKLFDEDNTSGVEAEFANTGDASGVVVEAVVFGS